MNDWMRKSKMDFPPKKNINQIVSVEIRKYFFLKLTVQFGSYWREKATTVSVQYILTHTFKRQVHHESILQITEAGMK